MGGQPQAATLSLAWPPKSDEAQPGSEGSRPEEAGIPCPSPDPRLPCRPPPAHVIPARADTANQRMSSQSAAPAEGLGHLEGDTVSPLARGMSEKEEWGFFVLVCFFFFFKGACLFNVNNRKP